MGNSFAIHVLRDEATHEQRDMLTFGTFGRRPDEIELAVEQVQTKTQKSAEGHRVINDNFV